jgi:hypothetical protein
MCHCIFVNRELPRRGIYLFSNDELEKPRVEDTKSQALAICYRSYDHSQTWYKLAGVPVKCEGG